MKIKVMPERLNLLGFGLLGLIGNGAGNLDLYFENVPQGEPFRVYVRAVQGKYLP